MVQYIVQVDNDKTGWTINAGVQLSVAGQMLDQGWCRRNQWCAFHLSILYPCSDCHTNQLPDRSLFIGLVFSQFLAYHHHLGNLVQHRNLQAFDLPNSYVYNCMRAY